MQDEGDGRQLAMVEIDRVQDRHCEILGAGFHVEAARFLDFRHVFAGGDRNAHPCFDNTVFIDARSKQVDPDNIFGQRSAGLDFHLFEVVSGKAVKCDHTGT